MAGAGELGQRGRRGTVRSPGGYGRAGSACNDVAVTGTAAPARPPARSRVGAPVAASPTSSVRRFRPPQWPAPQRRLLRSRRAQTRRTRKTISAMTRMVPRIPPPIYIVLSSCCYGPVEHRSRMASGRWRTQQSGIAVPAFAACASVPMRGRLQAQAERMHRVALALGSMHRGHRGVSRSCLRPLHS